MNSTRTALGRGISEIRVVVHLRKRPMQMLTQRAFQRKIQKTLEMKSRTKNSTNRSNMQLTRSWASGMSIQLLKVCNWKWSPPYSRTRTPGTIISVLTRQRCISDVAETSHPVMPRLTRGQDFSRLNAVFVSNFRDFKCWKTIG